MPTMRQQIIELLENNDHNAQELSQLLGISEKEVYTHMPHIGKTLSKTGRSLTVLPSSCLSCGHQFKKRDRPEPPSKCPLCKSERITNPRFSIK